MLSLTRSLRSGPFYPLVILLQQSKRQSFQHYYGSAAIFTDSLALTSLFSKNFKRSIIYILTYNLRLPLSTIMTHCLTANYAMCIFIITDKKVITELLAIRGNYSLIELQHGFVNLAIVIFWSPASTFSDLRVRLHLTSPLSAVRRVLDAGGLGT